MSLLLGIKTFQKFAVVVVGSGWWWSKAILEFLFGPNLGLRLEAGTKLNNLKVLIIDEISMMKADILYRIHQTEFSKL